MPRLVGKKSNVALYAGLGFLIAAVGAIALDYFGVVNFIPNFGKDANNPAMQPSSIDKEPAPSN